MFKVNNKVYWTMALYCLIFTWTLWRKTLLKNQAHHHWQFRLFCYANRRLFGRDYYHTAQKMKFSIKDFFSKCDQICRKLRIWSDLLRKSLMENFIFCAVSFYGYFLFIKSSKQIHAQG